MNKVLVTGIQGFVGQHLKIFLEKNSKKVFGIDLGTEERNVFNCDILDKEKLLGIISELSPEAVIHLAAQSSVEKSWKQPELTEKVNVGGTKNILDCVLEAGIDPRILIVSSGDIYGKTKEISFKETSPLNPDNPYSESRLKQEKLVLDYFKKHGMHLTISRSFSHTGPGQPADFVCSAFAKQVAEAEQGIIDSIKVGNLAAKRDFTDVRDIVKAYTLAVKKCMPGEIYNVCSGKALSIKSILDKLIDISGLDFKVEEDPKRIRPSDSPILVGDNTKFTNQTGWKPEIPLENTLKDMLDYWRKKI